jgi:hypothetical protein
MTEAEWLTASNLLVMLQFLRGRVRNDEKFTLSNLRHLARAVLQAVDPAATCCSALRCLYGNPFRLAFVDPAWLSWNGGTVGKLARAIYDDSALERLPILADALEDAGCSDQDILNHCRQPAAHVPGCWVVDLLSVRNDRP